MEQLPLQVGPADFAVFDNFLPGPNAALVHALKEIASLRQRALLWLWGAENSGRSHLLQATAAAADEAGHRAAYLPLAAGGGLSPDALAGFTGLDVVCIDDLDQIAGQPDWERSLFRLYEGLRAAGARLVVAADRGPLHVGLALPDLVSRMTSGATFRVQPLPDADKLAALRHRASWRGIELPEETARYLMTRVDRDTGALFGLLAELDRQAIVAQKRLTVPFVRQVLDDRRRDGVSAAD